MRPTTTRCPSTSLLTLHPSGADHEGIVIDPSDRRFWMVDEYRPAIYHFSSPGVLHRTVLVLINDNFGDISTAVASGG
jgi:Esterase-like activity of phytase